MILNSNFEQWLSTFVYVRCEGMNSWFQTDIFEADNNIERGKRPGHKDDVQPSMESIATRQPVGHKKIKETNKEGLKMGSLWNYSQADFDAFLKVFD